MDVPPPEESLANIERSLKPVRAHCERAGDDASLLAAGAIRWRLVSLLGGIADAAASPGGGRGAGTRHGVADLVLLGL